MVRAYTGHTQFRATGWRHLRWKFWVLDYLHHGRQRQRVGGGRTFTRLSGMAALYRPGTCYHEWQDTGGSLNESYLLFQLTGDAAKLFASLVRHGGYCHFRDPDGLIGDRLRKIGELLFHRRPGFHWLAQATFLELLGQVATSQPLAPRLRVVRSPNESREGNDLAARVERCIRQRIADPLRVADLARHAGLSVSAFAHRYQALAGESPYRTVMRLKIEAVKRLMLHDGLSVKQTADRLGYSSEFQLSRAFKRLEGVSPTRYLRALTEKARGN